MPVPFRYPCGECGRLIVAEPELLMKNGELDFFVPVYCTVCEENDKLRSLFVQELADIGE